MPPPRNLELEPLRIFNEFVSMPAYCVGPTNSHAPSNTGIIKAYGTITTTRGRPE